ncbi:hypothetical protein [Azospirillum sp. Sh1]|uniref:restriction endonuclease-related protein n=1 Tax=Azospirillum sp. Sh1 TaxID=2607285 RepID=UPI0011EC3B79|nr:hypothetical protein [Azospirillum sp. Sh1]KAA0578208.1 hypothetical protein FZ029_10105 [Azospirillum sp. Sh1]
MDFERAKHWSGTAEDAVEALAGMIGRLGLGVSVPTLRTVRLWRSKRLFSQPPGTDFRGRQLLEGVAIAILLKRGWSIAAVGDLLPTLDDAQLTASIVSESKGDAGRWGAAAEAPTRGDPARGRVPRGMADDAIVLLAQGILKQYNRILTEREIVRQDDGLPPELQAAMSRIGRLHIEEGQPDRAACVHDILDRARRPLDSEAWGLAAFRSPDFRFRQAVLIDRDLRVPTPDCSTIASVSGGFGEDNVIENRLHAALRDSSERLGVRRRHAAYTALRELLARRSLIAERELAQYLEDQGLTTLQEMVVESFYHPVPDAWLIDGRAHRCAHCGTLMRPHPDASRHPDGRCPVRQCNGKRPASVGERLNPEATRLLVALPQILTYWTGPGIDELAIHDEARRLGLDSELYPESDMCDVAIGGRDVGIDAKSYASPVTLALRLNRSIGGLIQYRRRIVAVGDEMVADDPDYLSVLRSSLDRSGDAATLEVKSLSSVLAMLRSLRDA